MEIPVKAAAAGLVMLAVFSISSALAFPTLRLVTNTNDSGDGSLRQTIIDADLSNTGDTIMFDSGVTRTIETALALRWHFVSSSSRLMNGYGAGG